MYYVKIDEKVVHDYGSFEKVDDAIIYSDKKFGYDKNVYVVDRNGNILAKRLTKRDIEQITTNKKERESKLRKFDERIYSDNISYIWEKFE